MGRGSRDDPGGYCLQLDSLNPAVYITNPVNIIDPKISSLCQYYMSGAIFCNRQYPHHNNCSCRHQAHNYDDKTRPPSARHRGRVRHGYRSHVGGH